MEERFTLAGGPAFALVRVELAGRRVAHYTLPAEEPRAWLDLADLAASGGSIVGDAGGRLVGVPARGDAVRFVASRRVRPLGIDQSNSSVVIGETHLLKLYRRVAAGANPEVEMAAALTGRAAAPLPQFVGSVRYLPGPRARSTAGSLRAADVAFLQGYEQGARDEFEPLADGLAAWLRSGAPDEERAGLLADVPLAGRAVGALHGALLGLPGKAFRPRHALPGDRAHWRARAWRTWAAARRALRTLDPGLAAELERRDDEIEAALGVMADAGMGTTIFRIHGDLHLGQLIRAADGFLIGDLEGEPTRSVAERRRADSPLRDLASMLRSLDHVARSGTRRAGLPGPGPAIEAWIAEARIAFLAAYRDALARAGTPMEVDPRLLHAFEVEKELYEFAYAAQFLPAWRYAPAWGLRWLLAHVPGTGPAQ